jgi:cell wall-associated NlpC family hydrolase
MGPGGGVRARILTVLGGLLVAAAVLVALPATAEAAGHPSLRQGSRGPSVVVLQSNLHIAADGVFGRQTKRYVMNFQRAHRLTADGIVGPRTWWTIGAANMARRRTAASSLGVRAVALAAAQRGKPYRWGAAGPNRFDCSGLVQYVFARLGVRVPRTTWTQYAALQHVSRNAARVGDLVFLDRLNHVGIYAGYDLIWNAPHTGSVVKLSKIWDRHYVVARVRG